MTKYPVTKESFVRRVLSEIRTRAEIARTWFDDHQDLSEQLDATSIRADSAEAALRRASEEIAGLRASRNDATQLQAELAKVRNENDALRRRPDFWTAVDVFAILMFAFGLLLMGLAGKLGFLGWFFNWIWRAVQNIGDGVLAVIAFIFGLLVLASVILMIIYLAKRFLKKHRTKAEANKKGGAA